MSRANLNFGRLVALASLMFAGTLTSLAQNGNGSIAGTVFDSRTGRPVPGVSVALNGQSSSQNLTDSDGQFVLNVSPGTYKLTFTAEGYSNQDVTDVVVTSGQTTAASTVLSSGSLNTTIDVVETISAVGADAAAMLTERRLAASVSDSLSHEELTSGASSDAAGALQKVTGVSVVGGGFVYVRGLGERYSSTQLNGAGIPTTEPEKRVVPLDLFPSGLLENIKIQKTYTPDMPAEFSGGLVQLQTIDFPTQKIFNFSMKSGFNTNTTFDRFLSYPGGSTDFFGFDDGTRGLPSLIPVNKRLIPGQFSQTELQAFGRAFSNNWEGTQRVRMRPSFDFSGAGGGTFGRYGIVGAISFSNRPQTQPEVQRYLRQGAGTAILASEYTDFRTYSEQARIGAVLNFSMRLNPNNKLMFRNTLTHDTEKTARQFSGYDGGVDAEIQSERLRWIERSLYSAGLEGDHSLPSWKNSLIHWQFTYSRSSRSEPDLREVFRGLLPNGKYIFSAFGSSGVRFFSDLKDKIYEPQVDYSIPFIKGSVSGLFKAGFRASIRERDFGARRFRYIPQQTSTLDLFAPSNTLFGPSNIRPNGFQIVEFTRGTDKYDATMNIYAGFAMVDLSLTSRIRLVGGLRFEDAEQIVNTVDNLLPNSVPVIAKLHNRDPTPGVNFIYAVTPKQNFRISYSRTVSRPDFRELSPFDFNDVLGGFVVQGNPNLKRAAIQNIDARWEAFATGNQVLAASVFAKKFDKPIETTVLPSNDLRQTYVNAQGATNVGFELEARRSLASFSQKLKAFAVTGNFTFVNSNIDIAPSDALLLTSKSRPLLGQSKYVSNAILEWVRPDLHSSVKFYANYVSRRVSNVGTFQLPDIYQEGNVILDLVYVYTPGEKSKWNLKIEAENLADNKYRWTQGTFDQRVYRTGRNFQIGLNYTLF